MSSYSKNLEYNYHSWEASESLSSYQYHAMTLTEGQLVLAGVTSVCIGILQDKPSAKGAMGLVAMGGISPAVCDGVSVNISALDRLAPNASGHLVKTIVGGDDYCAIALEACTADGDVKSVFLMPFAELSTG